MVDSGRWEAPDNTVDDFLDDALVYITSTQEDDARLACHFSGNLVEARQSQSGGTFHDHVLLERHLPHGGGDLVLVALDDAVDDGGRQSKGDGVLVHAARHGLGQRGPVLRLEDFPGDDGLGQRLGVGSGDAVDPGPRAEGLEDGADAADEAAAAHGDEDIVDAAGAGAALLEDLEADGALPGDDERVVGEM
ncbi:LOW QUALITY PROTEIN: hypothetical protein CH63R_13623 [Colletotrichum higginsianum IMI 349063]|uniref:Uncharacterized protein n=1 Tax=Colletotrichum higginsianum (strain IMI 349063) TaxID=759273 RepID=A0A1B7XRL6_COLHI|nr:LOW QUALITY PROTEIN: hypothetical protein CH63R_13623 [Colletotrichum higginsianum IMI 349063]OBR02397.1 LOW QUALITY PROTEIN: hypothetical protein CH63R_13623 [Colletotrichum higginsianum IMI 349063]